MKKRVVIGGIVAVGIIAGVFLYAGPVVLQMLMQQETSEMRAELETRVRCSEMHIEVVRRGNGFTVRNIGTVSASGTLTAYSGGKKVAERSVTVEAGQIAAVAAAGADRAVFRPDGCPSLTFASDGS